MSRFLRVFFFSGDLTLLNVSILLSFAVNSTSYWQTDKSNVVYLLIYSNLSWLFLVMVSAPYSLTKGWTLSRVIKEQLAFIFIHLLIVGSLIFFFRKNYSLQQVSLMYGIFVPFFFSYRIIVFYLRKILTREIPFKNYIIVGQNDLALQVRKYFLVNPQLGYKFQGYFDFMPGNFQLDQIRTFCGSQGTHEIYCCIDDAGESDLKQLINFGLDSLIKVRVMFSASGTKQQSIQLDENPLPAYDVATIPLDDPLNQSIKRVVDFFLASAFGVLVLSWLVPLVGLIIKLDSRGPVFFVQLRSGKGNQPFKCLKFRTMVVNKESDTRQASKDDHRITRLGQFLRRTSIDELPQFINVILGTMSIVGPRPHMLRHTEEYSKLIEKFMGRHYVTPGITGLAQCMGYRGETKDISDMVNRVRLDHYYIEHWSLWLDIKIIFLTVVGLIRGSDKAF